MIKLVVQGNPVPQARPRFTRINGLPRAYDTAECVNAKRQIQLVAKGRVKELIESDIKLELDVYRSIPESFSKRKRELADSGKLRPTTRPDADNYGKLVLDALNGVAWTDDSLVVDLRVRKFYSNNPRSEIRIYPMSEVDDD